MIKQLGKAAFIAAFILSVPSWAVAQTHRATVSGFVLDAESEESLPGALVISDEGTTTTNNYGFFSIPLVLGEHTLTLSYLGHDEYEISMQLLRDTTIVVKMRPDAVLKESIITSGAESNVGYARVPVNEILRTPVVLGEPDVLKSIQILPGVSGGLEGTSSIIVRGGGPDENLFLMDGVPMYNVSHMLGVFSAFSPDALKSVSFYKSHFPARFGGRVSSVLDIRTNDGDLHDYHASVTAGLLSSRIHVDGPLIMGKTSFSLSARALNTVFASPFIKKDDFKYFYLFYDLNAKLYHVFSPYDTIMMTVYNGGDSFRYLSDENMISGSGYRYITQEGMNMDWGSTLTSLKWNHLSRQHFFYSTSISWYGYNMMSEVNDWKKQSHDVTLDKSVFKSKIHDCILHIDIDYALSSSQKLLTGISATRHCFVPSVSRRSLFLGSNETTLIDPASNYEGWELGPYVEDIIRLNDKLWIDAGLRYTIMTVGQKAYRSLQPRLSIDAKVLNSLSLRSSFSRMAQYVHLLTYSQLSMPTDLWVPITESIPPVLTDHYSVGFILSPKGWNIEVDCYYKHSDNVLEYKNGASFMSSGDSWEALVDVGEGRSKGIELSVSKTIGPVKGNISYTLSKTERRFESGGFIIKDWFPFIYDRTHNVVLNLSYSLSNKVNINALWTFASGNKMTLPSRKGLYLDVTQPGFVYVGDVYTAKNNYTLPPSHRLDISINYNKPLRHGSSIWTVGIYNVYDSLNPNIAMADYMTDDNDNLVLKVKKMTYLPILPSISYTYKF